MGYFVLLIFFVVLYVRVLEFRSLYLPARDVTVNPSQIGLDFEEITLLAPDGPTLSGWYIPGRQPDRIVFFLHGNGGNISHRLEKIRFFNDLGFCVFILEYRGYGRSTGFPSEKGLYADARAGYDYLIAARHVQPDTLVVYGESLGAAVAVELARQLPVGVLVLEGAFTSVADMGKRVYPFLPSFLVASRYNSLAKIGDIASPVIFIHSRNDEIVPFEMGQALYEACRSKKLFLATTGAHNEQFMIHKDRLKDDLKKFLAKD